MTHQSVPHMVRSFARLFGPKPILVCAAGSVEYTWLDLQQSAWAMATGLIEAGFPAGATAIIAAADSPEALFAEVAVQAAGGVPLTVQPSVAEDELLAEIQTTDCAALISDGLSGAVAETAAMRAGRPMIEWRLDPVVPGTTTPATEGKALAARLEHLGPEVPAVVLRTGFGRHVVLPHRAIVWTGEAVARAFGGSETDSWLVTGPLSHPFTRACGWWAPLASCGQAILGGSDALVAAWAARPSLAVCLASDLPQFIERILSELKDVQGVQNTLARWAVEARTNPAAGLGAHLRKALASLAGPGVLREVVGGELNRLVAGYGPVEAQCVRVLEALGVEVLTAWGLAEATGVVALGQPDWLPGGRPLEGLEVTADETGELLVRGPSVMFAHLGLSPEVDPGFKDGALRTGHTGRVDPDGRVVVTGRIGGQGG